MIRYFVHNPLQPHCVQCWQHQPALSICEIDRHTPIHCTAGDRHTPIHFTAGATHLFETHAADRSAQHAFHATPIRLLHGRAGLDHRTAQAAGQVLRTSRINITAPFRTMIRTQLMCRSHARTPRSVRERRVRGTTAIHRRNSSGVVVIAVWLAGGWAPKRAHPEWDCWKY